MEISYIRICPLCHYRNGSSEQVCVSCGYPQLAQEPLIETEQDISSDVTESENFNYEQPAEIVNDEPAEYTCQTVGDVDSEAILGGYAHTAAAMEYSSPAASAPPVEETVQTHNVQPQTAQPQSAVAAFLRTRPHVAGNVSVQQSVRPTPAPVPTRWQLVSEDGTARLVIGMGQKLMVGAEGELTDYLYPKMHVSSKHAHISVTSSGCFIRDISRNGTAVNGNRIARDTDIELHPGDKICFGSAGSVRDEKAAYFKIDVFE